MMTQDPDKKREFSQALNEVLVAHRDSEDELRQVRAVRERRDRGPNHRPWLTLFIVVAWAFVAYVWIARPAFLFEGPTPTETTASQREARLRYAVYLQRGRVAAYRTEHGRLPETLREAGPVEEGVEYERTSDSSYTVFGTVDGTVLRLSDRMSADSFLGDALRRLPPPPQ